MGSIGTFSRFLNFSNMSALIMDGKYSCGFVRFGSLKRIVEGLLPALSTFLEQQSFRIRWAFVFEQPN